MLLCLPPTPSFLDLKNDDNPQKLPPPLLWHLNDTFFLHFWENLNEEAPGERDNELVLSLSPETDTQALATSHVESGEAADAQVILTRKKKENLSDPEARKQPKQLTTTGSPKMRFWVGREFI